MKKERLIQIAYWVLAVCIFAGLLLFLKPLREKQYAFAPQLMVFGDSLMGECRDENSIPAKLGKLLGMPSFNGAFGGTRMSRMETERRMDQSRDGLSLAALSKAAAAEDFGVQQMVHITDGGTGYFDGAIDDLDRVDFRNVEVFLMGFGLNDYHNAIPIENPDNPYDEYTLLGAGRSSIRTLQKAYPKAQIVLTTPTFTWYPSLGLTCETYDTGNGYLEKYVDALFRLAEETEVEIIDLYHDFYPHDAFEDWELYTRDGMHPNEEGRKKIAEKIAASLQK